MGMCDICCAEDTGRLVSSSQMREAVLDNGFNPFKLGLVSWESGSPEEFEFWKGTIVEQDVSDWGLCEHCFAAVRPYFSGEPTPAGISGSFVSPRGSVSSNPVREYAARISNSTTTRITRSWRNTLINSGFALAAITAAVALWSNEHEVWATILAFLGLGAAIVAFLSGKAVCPICGKQMETLVGIDQCPHCGLYSRAENKSLQPISPGFVSDQPIFAIEIKSLNDPSIWKCRWQDSCCVCDRPAIRYETLGFDKEFKRYIIKVGHCGEHKTGVASENFKLKFRSFDSWLKFTSSNAKGVTSKT
jgi:hypothetical protein